MRPDAQNVFVIFLARALAGLNQDFAIANGEARVSPRLEENLRAVLFEMTIYGVMTEP